MPPEPTGDDPAAGPLRVLMICEGNVCRSPLAAALLQAAAPHGIAVVESAGLRAATGLAQPPEMRTLAERHGVAEALRGQVPRQLDGAIVADADLVLTATLAQRSAVATLAPGAARRTFTLLEFARVARALSNGALEDPDALPDTADGPSIVGGASSDARARLAAEVAARAAPDATPGDLLRAWVELAAAMRGAIPRPATGELDVPDPYRHAESVYVAVGDAVAGAVRVIADELTALVAEVPDRTS